MLDLVHMDVYGPLSGQTQEGYRHWIIFVDDAHRFWVVIMLGQKSEAFHIFLHFKAFAKWFTGQQISSIVMTRVESSYLVSGRTCVLLKASSSSI
jgi:hypothetical protein